MSDGYNDPPNTPITLEQFMRTREYDPDTQTYAPSDTPIIPKLKGTREQ